MPNLAKKSDRDKLPVRRDPHWMSLGDGCALGFRRGTEGDSWIARCRTKGGAYQFKALGSFDAMGDARKAADKWFGQMITVHAVSTRGTVADALRAYLDHQRTIDREEGADIAAGKFRTCIMPNIDRKPGARMSKRKDDPIAAMSLESATRQDWLAFRARLKDVKGRANVTVNRYLGAVTAGLNRAVEDLSFVGLPDAWTFDDLPDNREKGEGEEAVYFTEAQRERLIAHTAEWMRPYLRMLHATGARPSEIAKAKVSDFDAKERRITLRMKKGRPVKVVARFTEIEAQHLGPFVAAIKGKFPASLLVTDEDRKPLQRHVWAREIREAIGLANANATPEQYIPVDVSAYSFRHSRISELLQTIGVDAVTVADQTGTSLAMMVKYYWKFVRNDIRKKFDAAAQRA